MKEGGSASSQQSTRSARRFQPQDFAWLLFIGVLIATAPDRSYQALIIVPIIGAFQIMEPRWRLFSSERGQVASVTLKLLLSYLLVGWTHGVASYYYPIFLIPVVSAATLFELRGVVLVIGIACAAYFSFLSRMFINYAEFELPPDYLSVMSLRAAFYAIVGFLVYQQAHAKRVEMKRTQEAAARLAKSNRDLQEAHASLRRSERLAALGQLTAGLAHELRNPLGTIKASAEMLSKPAAKKRPEVMDEMAGFITSEVDRMNALVASFLDFARPLQIRPVENDLKGVIEGVMREQSELARTRGVKLVTKAEDHDLIFAFDRDLLRLALSNLVQNAIQASAAGQEVELRAETTAGPVVIFVSDEGEGIRREHLESIFNPFFTTKTKGIGLGLALVAKIVDEHGGRIQVWSELGKGTRFELMLPRG